MICNRCNYLSYDLETTRMCNCYGKCSCSSTEPSVNQVFWIVWIENGGVPTRRHTTLQSARDEASRLAQKTQKRVHVFESLGSFAPTDNVMWTTTNVKNN